MVLIRSTLLSLNDALHTGNYTVLRDLASPSFREANSAGRLVQIFSSLAAQRIDLTAVAILAPKLPNPPAIDQNRRLRISGFFPGEPVQINFDLTFEAVANQWRLFGISVNPAKSASADCHPGRQPQPPAPGRQKETAAPARQAVEVANQPPVIPEAEPRLAGRGETIRDLPHGHRSPQSRLCAVMLLVFCT